MRRRCNEQPALTPLLLLLRLFLFLWGSVCLLGFDCGFWNWAGRMLQIRLRRDSPTETGSGARPSPTETVTVACPDHLVLADLPVAKGIGSVTPTTVIKPVGRRSRRQLGERVHFCVRCDFPIAIYGRLVTPLFSLFHFSFSFVSFVYVD